ncbi:MAG: threonine--tRNA ligase [Patescibacteria group bacterium]
MNDQHLQAMRHSTAHLLAAAILELLPNTKLTIGPAIEHGFYYDFEFNKEEVQKVFKQKNNDNRPVSEKIDTLNANAFARIEQKMAELLKTWGAFSHREVTEKEAKDIYKDNPYKLELIEGIIKKGEKITLYKVGDFEDLCRGGHSEEPKKDIGAFKLLSIAGAYWRGDEKNKMLTRVYGTAFASKKELEEHLVMLEEAKKRDHRKLGKDLDLFVLSDLVGKGLPLFTPKGTLLRELLNDYSQGLREEKGFSKVWTPHITKNDLYKVSGHWDKFGKELFLVKSQETTDEMVMKPMNCPHHQQIYASRIRSYRDLPIKYMETTTDYRDEKAGELLGLARVRSLTQDDSHAFCTPEQIDAIYDELIEVVQTFYKTIGMKLRARLSFRDPQTPEKYIGDDALWEKAQEIILKVAKKNKLDYYTAEGEAAFYGPKIDFMAIDALGREWQVATPQLDFVQPKRFGLTYIDQDGKEQTPVMIHFALMGSIERFLSVYIEHTAGAFPLWLAPVQVSLLPIADRHNEYAEKIAKELQAVGIRAEADVRSERLQAKIRDATLQKVPFMGIIGDKEIADEVISVRKRNGEDLGRLAATTFLTQLRNDIDKKR